VERALLPAAFDFDLKGRGFKPRRKQPPRKNHSLNRCAKPTNAGSTVEERRFSAA
jgi:hypothetical protein